MKSSDTGSSADTPFVYFASGTPIYPPNTIYEAASNAINAAAHKPLKEVLKGLAQEGLIAGSWTILPEAWWYHFLLAYMTYFGNNFSEPEKMEDSAFQALKLMTKTPPETAWLDLLLYIIGEIDNLSGWAKSWVKESAEQRKVFKGKDGNYYFRDFDGTLIQTIGSKTTKETTSISSPVKFLATMDVCAKSSTRFPPSQ